MQEILLTLANSAALGSWPAAFAIAILAIACAFSFCALLWFLVRIGF